MLRDIPTNEFEDGNNDQDDDDDDDYEHYKRLDDEIIIVLVYPTIPVRFKLFSYFFLCL